MLVLPGCWVVWDEAVGHHDEGQDSAGDVLHWEVDSQPDPPVHLVQVNTSKQVPHGPQSLARHGECKERFPSKPVTPAADVEGEEDGDSVLRDGDNVVKVDHLNKYTQLLIMVSQSINLWFEKLFLMKRKCVISCLLFYISIYRILCVLLDIGAEAGGQVISLL